jgi:hypothetical protein
MKKLKKLNLKKRKIANINNTYSIKGGLTLGCDTHNTCPKSAACPPETLQETCTSLGFTECVTLTTSPPTDDCDGFPTGACGG